MKNTIIEVKNFDKTDFSKSDISSVTINSPGKPKKGFNFFECENLRDISIISRRKQRLSESILLIENLSGCSNLASLKIDYPCWLDFSKLEDHCKGLKYLYVSDCYFLGDMTIPKSLQRLEIKYSNLTKLGVLPSGLGTLRITDCPLTELPELPDYLGHLSINSTNIVCLRSLPESLYHLSVQNEPLRSGCANIPVEILCLPNNLSCLDLSNACVDVGKIDARNASVVLKNCILQKPVTGIVEEFMYITDSEELLDLSEIAHDCQAEKFTVDCSADFDSLQSAAHCVKHLNIVEYRSRRFPDLSKTGLVSLKIEHTPYISGIPRILLPSAFDKLEIEINSTGDCFEL